MQVEQRLLEECILDYDLLVFDYFATGSLLALMSDKPVIYFAIGLRRLHSGFMEDLKKRCEYAKIDVNQDMREQVRLALSAACSNNKERSNSALVRYTLCDESRFNWLDLFFSTSRGVVPPW